MAYNVLRGTIDFSDATAGSFESMTDERSAQTVAGVKTNGLAASAEKLTVKGGDGITVGGSGVAVSVRAHNGV
jgi:hypothetical protein